MCLLLCIIIIASVQFTKKISSMDDLLMGLIVCLNIILITALTIAAVVFGILCYYYNYKPITTKGNWLKFIAQCITCSYVCIFMH